MKLRTAVHRSIALALLSTVALPAVAVLASAAQAYTDQARYFDREQIEQLTAPIALYPDPLLAQILTAAAYPAEIASAQRYARGRSDWNDIDRQDWDPSVRAVARYPEVLDFLARDLEWTEALGVANINQPDDVADAIQRWRLQAYNLGNLRSDSQQIVYVENGYVRIVPAESDYFYVPRYEPSVVYVTRYIGTPFIIFGPAYAYGAWFDRDWDWRRRRICYTDRRHWHHGRPVFYPRFDDVHPDRDWQPDRRRFKPPETPRMPPRWEQTKIPSPPPNIKPGTRLDDRPRTDGRDQPRPTVLRPGDKPDAARDIRRDGDRRDNDRREPVKPADGSTSPKDSSGKSPTVRQDYNRGDRPGDGRPVTQPQSDGQPKRVESPKVEQPRRLEQPTKVEQPRQEQPKQEPRRIEQPQQQQQQQQPQQRQAPGKRIDDDQQNDRGPRR